MFWNTYFQLSKWQTLNNIEFLLDEGFTIIIIILRHVLLVLCTTEEKIKGHHGNS